MAGDDATATCDAPAAEEKKDEKKDDGGDEGTDTSCTADADCTEEGEMCMSMTFVACDDADDSYAADDGAAAFCEYGTANKEVSACATQAECDKQVTKAESEEMAYADYSVSCGATRLFAAAAALALAATM